MDAATHLPQGPCDLRLLLDFIGVLMAGGLWMSCMGPGEQTKAVTPSSNPPGDVLLRRASQTRYREPQFRDGETKAQRLTQGHPADWGQSQKVSLSPMLNLLAHLVTPC